MIVAVTGANGFIGRHLCVELARAGHDVRAAVRDDFARGGLDEKLRGADVVVHAAGATRAPSVAQLRRSNVDLTRDVIDRGRAAGVRRIVFVSSQAAAGPARSLDAPVTEQMAPAPIEEYGRSKADAEQIVRGASDLESVIVRPAAVYGPGDRDFLTMFRLVSRGVAIHPGNRDHWISIVHVADLVRAIARAAEDPAARGQTFFVANTSPIRWADAFQLAGQAVGRRLRVDINLPYSVVYAASLLGDAAARITGRTGLVSSGKVALSRPAFWICSNARASTELAFAESGDIAAGFAETYRWYREHHWL